MWPWPREHASGSAALSIRTIPVLCLVIVFRIGIPLEPRPEAEAMTQHGILNLPGCLLHKHR